LNQHDLKRKRKRKRKTGVGVRGKVREETIRYETEQDEYR
jgi:hypothetical protein